MRLKGRPVWFDVVSAAKLGPFQPCVYWPESTAILLALHLTFTVNLQIHKACSGDFGNYALHIEAAVTVSLCSAMLTDLMD
jgi:hypothetical protein